ncbi:hypothetical protein IX51_08205 [uncultured archaeon]|nr:hypothetical protein IX51_08205 [uncultured archaeon]HKJ96970.1 hypothetical protein [Thermoplasmataceae archaeon]
MENVEDLMKSGDKSLQKEKYIDAIREYTKALESVEDKSSSVAGELYYKISQAYYAFQPKNNENSLDYGKKALEVHEKTDELDLQIMDLLNLGYIEMDGGSKGKSVEFFEEAAKRAGSVNDDVLINISLLAKAELLSKEKSRQKEAVDIYEKVLSSAGESGDWDNYFEALHGKLALMRKNGDEKGAFKIALDSLDLIDKISSQIKNKKEKKAFKQSFDYMYDMASDIAMEMEDVEQAIKIAQRLEGA